MSYFHLRTFCLFASFLLLFTCCQSGNNATNAQEVVDRAIETHGGSAFENAHIQFNFRDRTYVYKREGGIFEYRRIFADSSGRQVTDILTNTDFTRLMNSEPTQLKEERARAYASSVNSVIYFALLPYRLNDEAVQKEYLGTAELEGVPYYKVKVSFTEEGGGEDFEDIYVFWFRQDTHTLDYLAYSFHTNGGGYRFRKAHNPRTFGGIRWQDYINYKPATTEGLQVEQLDELFKTGKLKELSRIELKNLHVFE
jgi:hypothetical protein